MRQPIGVAISGGYDSAVLAHAAQAQGRRVRAIFAAHAYLPRLAWRNVGRLTRDLRLPLNIGEADPRRHRAALRWGFVELHAGATPWASVCARCSACLHAAIEAEARAAGCQEVWYGFEPDQVREMDLVVPAGGFERWPFCDGTFEFAQAARGAAACGIVPGGRWSSLRTNCEVNWLVLAESLRLGRGDPYLPYFRGHAASQWKRAGWSCLSRLARLGIKCGVLKRRTIRQLREDLLGDG